MARKKLDDEKLLPGMYKRGALHWIRTVLAPLLGIRKALSTGAGDIPTANAVKRMVDGFAKNPTQYGWLSLAVQGAVTLERLYIHHAAGTLHLLKEQLDAAAAEAADSDLSPHVEAWASKYLTVQSINDRTRRDYVNKVRALIPAGVRFATSDFTVDTLTGTLLELKGARHDADELLGDTTRRHYVAAWHLFYQYARSRVQNLPNPFDDRKWIPKMGDPRETTLSFENVQAVLGHMRGEHKVAMTLIFGTGMELGALLGMRRSHLGTFAKRLEDDERVIVAPGTKNQSRRDREIYVDAWAWPALREHAKDMLPMAQLWSYDPEGEADELREAFYEAQVKAGLLAEPPVNPDTRKKLWGRVNPHRIHDARHTFCIIRGLGQDGAEPEDLTYLAHQLGHVDESMVMKIYKKKNMKARFEQIQRKRAAERARGATPASSATVGATVGGA